MTTTRPGYIWSGTEWVAIGQEAVVAPVSYQTSAPSTPATGDIWIDSDDDVPGIDTSQFLRWRKTMAGGETSLSGTDDNGLTLKYTPNYEQLYINGVLQVRAQDYTATNGTTITGLTALAANDVVEVFGVVARTVGDVYTQAQADGKYSPITTTGLVLLNTTTFSAQASVSLNNVFTSVYEDYWVNITASGSATSVLRFRYRASGTDTSANYKMASARFGTTTYYETQVTNGATFGVTEAAEETTAHARISQPNLAKKTKLSGTFHDRDLTGVFSSVQTGTTQFDGFTIYPDSGTISGTIKVYGYK